MTLLEQFTAIAGIQDGYEFAEQLDTGSISFLIAGCEGFSMEEKQRFLEMTSSFERLAKCVGALEKIIERTKITAQIRKIIGGNGDMAKFSS
jgi:ATP-dependent Lon protease